MATGDLAVKRSAGLATGARLLENVQRDDTARRQRERRNTAVGRLLFAAAFFLAWELSSGRIVDQFFVSKPSAIAASWWAMLVKESLLYHLQFTIVEALTGYLIGAVAGLIMGFALARSELVYRIVEPFVVGFYGIPRIALAPLFILWFGIGEEPKLALVASGVAFPLYLNLHAGIRQTDPGLVEAAKVLGYSRIERIVHVVLPSAVPQTLVGLRIALGTAWLSLIVGEQINADAGLGFLINNAREFLRTDVVVVGLVVYALLGLTTDALVRLLERRVLRWRAR